MTPELPATPHWPGRNARPAKSVFAGYPVREGADFPDCPAFVAGMSCFSRGYFWEAHEFWEPLWAAQTPNSRERHLIRGLIQLANARLKAAMGADKAAARLRALAQGACDEAFRGRTVIRGLESARISALLSEM